MRLNTLPHELRAPAATGRSSHAKFSINGMAVRFRPCIDIHKVRLITHPSYLTRILSPFQNCFYFSLSHIFSPLQGKVKQIVGSTLSDLKEDGSEHQLRTNFESEKPSSYYAELYASDKLPGGHVIMLGADEASRKAALSALRAYPGGLQLGGGVTDQNATGYLDAGASHVIVTSFVFREGRLEEDRLAALVAAVGKHRLVLDLSCRRKEDGKYYVVTDRWQKWSELALSESSLAALSESCDEFLIHGVDVEGMQLGIDDELVELLGRWSPVPVTYAGGARTIEDLERVAVAGGGRVDVTIGSALDIFGGKLAYTDVVEWHAKQNQRGSGQGDGGEKQSDGSVLYSF